MILFYLHLIVSEIVYKLFEDNENVNNYDLYFQVIGEHFHNHLR